MTKRKINLDTPKNRAKMGIRQEIISETIKHTTDKEKHRKTQNNEPKTRVLIYKGDIVNGRRISNRTEPLQILIDEI